MNFISELRRYGLFDEKFMVMEPNKDKYGRCPECNIIYPVSKHTSKCTECISKELTERMRLGEVL